MRDNNVGVSRAERPTTLPTPRYDGSGVGSSPTTPSQPSIADVKRLLLANPQFRPNPTCPRCEQEVSVTFYEEHVAVCSKANGPAQTEPSRTAGEAIGASPEH